MLQYYLRAEGIALSWVGTGRLIFSLNYTDADFAAVVDRFVAACRAMQRDGWWWSGETTTNKSIKRRILREVDRRRRVSGAAMPRSRSAIDYRSHPCSSPSVQVSWSPGRRAAATAGAAMVELDVVERVGDDLGRPDQPGLHDP